MIDDSPAGSWRSALAPDHRGCAACGQNICDHSDAEYQGIVPGNAPARSTKGAASINGAAPDRHKFNRSFHAQGISNVRP